jgi:hypothetical protein
MEVNNTQVRCGKDHMTWQSDRQSMLNKPWSQLKQWNNISLSNPEQCIYTVTESFIYGRTTTDNNRLAMILFLDTGFFTSLLQITASTRWCPAYSGATDWAS